MSRDNRRVRMLRRLVRRNYERMLVRGATVWARHYKLVKALDEAEQSADQVPQEASAAERRRELSKKMKRFFSEGSHE